MARQDPLEAAYQRSSLMIALLQAIRDDALKDPTRNRWKDLGLVEVGDTKSEAFNKITSAFEEILNLLNHVRIVDLTASFELLARQRMDNHLGEARKALSGSAKKRLLPVFHERLALGSGDFGGLNDYIHLLDGHLSKEVVAALKVIREARNAYAHGTDLGTPPKVSADQTLANLSAARDLL